MSNIPQLTSSYDYKAHTPTLFWEIIFREALHYFVNQPRIWPFMIPKLKG